MMRVPPLPAPFLDHGHRQLALRFRAVWSDALVEVENEFDAQDLSEDVAARRFVEVLATDGLLAKAVRSDARSLCVAREEAAAVSGFGDNQLALQGLGSRPIERSGNQEMIERHAIPAAEGRQVAAFALTEPEAGSDANSIRTRAVKDGEHYVLNGTKTLITNAGVADFYTVFTRFGEGDGTAAFVVPADTPGFQVVERFQLLAAHPIGRLQFRDCRVPASHRLGPEGEGLALAMQTLERFRPSVGAAALGLASRALAEAAAHLREREQFGRPLAKFQLLRGQLADMFVDLELARLAVYRAAWLLDGPAGQADAPLCSSLAKLSATEAAFRVVDQALQMFGGRGVVRGEVVERLYREVRALRIYEGTTEIQKLILAKGLLERIAD